MALKTRFEKKGNFMIKMIMMAAVLVAAGVQNEAKETLVEKIQKALETSNVEELQKIYTPLTDDEKSKIAEALSDEEKRKLVELLALEEITEIYEAMSEEEKLEFEQALEIITHGLSEEKFYISDMTREEKEALTEENKNLLQALENAFGKNFYYYRFQELKIRLAIAQTWNCYDALDTYRHKKPRLPKDSLIRLKNIEAYSNLAMISLRGNISHIAKSSIAGFDRRWDFPLHVNEDSTYKDSAYKYAFIIEPDGTGIYYDFTTSEDGKASGGAIYKCFEE